MVIFNSYVKLPEGRFCEILGVMHELDRKKGCHQPKIFTVPHSCLPQVSYNPSYRMTTPLIAMKITGKGL